MKESKIIMIWVWNQLHCCWCSVACSACVRGSTAEIVRVLGGPAVGDIRSRCLRLADDHNDEARAVKRLLGHRLAPFDKEAAKMEWYSIVEGNHELWCGVSEPYKHTIRAFLVHFHTAILRQSTEQFSFRNGSVGALITDSLFKLEFTTFWILWSRKCSFKMMKIVNFRGELIDNSAEKEALALMRLASACLSRKGFCAKQPLRANYYQRGFL